MTKAKEKAKPTRKTETYRQTPFEQARDLIDELGKDMEKEDWIDLLDELISDLDAKKTAAEGELRDSESERDWDIDDDDDEDEDGG